MSPDVTVCIPAYRSEAFLHHTLRSVLAQSHSNLVVDIAIEPPAGATQDACDVLLRDERVTTVVNPEVLGWGENIRQMLGRVKTPYFAILFHDDLIVPDYISTLIGELKRRPSASVAYSDIMCFGHESFRLGLRLVSAPIFDRLMSFFLGGAEAVPVRGVARSSVLAGRQFPTDEYGGLATECEWVLHLLVVGPAIHLPQPLYLKRIFAANEITASNKRLLGYSREYLFEGLEQHRMRMLALLEMANCSKEERMTIELAAEAALLRRHMTFGMGHLNSVQLARSEKLSAHASSAQGNYGNKIQAMNLLVRSQHAVCEGDQKAALILAMEATRADPNNPEGLAHLCKLQLANARYHDAFDTALKLWTAEPDCRGLRQLLGECANAFDQHNAIDMMRNGKLASVANRFDAARYLVDHPDVAAAGVDPWEHFCEHGWHEGRKVRLLPIAYK